MTNKLFLSFLTGLLFLASCREKEPPEESVAQGPLFKLSGTIDGMPINLAAGEGSYMNSSWDDDGDGVFEFNGILKQSCSSCKQSLKVSFRNYKHNSGSSSYKVDSALAPNNYNFFFNAPPANTFRVYFTGEPSGQGPASHYWDFGDGTTSTQESPMKEYLQRGSYLVHYTASFGNGCSSSISYPVNLSASVGAKNNSGFGYSYLDNNQVMLFCKNNSDQILWDLGQGQFSSNTSITLPLSAGVRLVSLKRISASNDTVEVRRNIASQNYLLCNANFNHFVLDTPGGLNLSTISIEWTDAAGNVYSSRNVKQEPLHSFRVLSSSPYLKNELGQKTRKLQIAFDCLLSNGTHTIEMKNMKGTVAVAYP